MPALGPRQVVAEECEAVDRAVLVSQHLVLVVRGVQDAVLVDMVIVVVADVEAALVVDVLVLVADHVHTAHKNLLFQHSDLHNKDNA